MKWFKHDTDANNDAKLKRLKIKYGMAGYGLYWHCLELVAAPVEKHNLTFELEHDAEIIAHDTGINYELVQEMMTFMVDQGLFENDNGVITCLKLARRTDEYTAKLIRHLDAVPTNSGQSPDKVPPNRREQKRLEKKNTNGLSSQPACAKTVTESLKSIYPKRSGSQRWQGCVNNINARLKEGYTPDEILEGAKRYSAYIAALGHEGTSYVQQAATFCGTNKGFTEAWEMPDAEPTDSYYNDLKRGIAK